MNAWKRLEELVKTPNRGLVGSAADYIEEMHRWIADLNTKLQAREERIEELEAALRALEGK